MRLPRKLRRVISTYGFLVLLVVNALVIPLLLANSYYQGKRLDTQQKQLKSLGEMSVVSSKLLLEIVNAAEIEMRKRNLERLRMEINRRIFLERYKLVPGGSGLEKY